MKTELLPSHPNADTSALNRIRVETALSRFPIHRLAKKGTIAIDLQSGPELKWEVTYNTKHGQPGPLAYKLDTLIVNRRIDEASRPLPEVIKLGALREICRELGLSDHDTESVKKAFHQNASAYITAKIRYKTKTGKERWTEIGYSRYSIVFTGEMLPDGATADSVYIIINASHRDLLNQVEARPLDYDYLTKLAPGPQRFYELLSFQVYGAIASGRPRAKMLYSDYCKYSPQVRYLDFNHVKKQMYKIHVSHRASGYIVKVDYQEIKDVDGNPDWEMFYTPGPKAQAEFQSFANRQVRRQIPSTQLTAPRVIGNSRSTRPVQSSLCLAECDNVILAEMLRRGITEKKSLDLLARRADRQEITDQLEYVDHMIEQAPKGKFHNPSGFYVKFIEDNSQVPDSFWSSRKIRSHEQSQQEKDNQLAKERRRAREYDEYRRNEVQKFVRDSLAPEEYQDIFDKALQENRRTYKLMTSDQLKDLTRAAVDKHLAESGRIQMLSFEEYIQHR